ncbi:rhamnan synthesis F family protein [uncultured Mailhella sp.]|uniref:rhamnan synthesis F family protein n=1 Tax=uncultured Mailhella sp. TaxID=1981031 RepID=UPI0025D4C67B|nr:rhamnan synthesis F family protein [uncultured Mailhella sp.]
MKRLALYVFWEKDGIVRDYVTYYLNALKEVAQNITVIVNGKLSAEGRKKLEAADVDIFVRKNEGLDFAAWKAALDDIGWDKLALYDELILCNCSCYGPVYPFSESFQIMESRECDFWGMTRHPKIDRLLISDDPESRLEEHIQSFFIVFRKKIFRSTHFRRWWEDLVPANSYFEEVGHHEVKFTEYLESAGYTSSCLVDMKKYFDLAPNDNATILYADKMLVEDRMPLIKRKLFVRGSRWWIRRCMGHVAGDVFRLLKERTSYPEAFIWEDLLATQKFSDVKDALHLNYILPSNLSEKTVEKTDTALLCFAYYPELCVSMCRYIASMPEDAHICIISSREDTLDTYRAEMAKLPFRSVEYRLKPNRGRDVSAYLVTGRDILQNHELICCVHDKKSKQLSRRIMGEDFGYHCMECCLHSKDYVRNIIAIFHKEPFCGLLVPPTVYYGDFCTLGAESFRNKKSMAEAYEMLSLSCPIDDNPVAPFGAYFWCRGTALAAMFRHDWKYEDFPDEPLPLDSTISHGIERIYPLAVQDEGYYTVWCSPDVHASLYMNNITYMIREYNKRLYKIYEFNNWSGMIEALDRDIKNKFLYVENMKFNKIKYFKYKVLSKITFGFIRNYYKKKYNLFKKLKKLQEN